MERVQSDSYNGHTIATAFHDAGGKKVVIFCHGYRGTSVGPSRFFVLAARRLAEHGISSLRFDQHGSGNSDGDFFESSFNDWVATTKSITEDYLARGYEVALFGQSMGGATVITVASQLNAIKAMVAWVPDPNVETFTVPESGIIEEGGQRVSAHYWQEAHDMQVAEKLTHVSVPAYIVQCSDDEYVSSQNHDAIIANAQQQHVVDMYEGYKHSAWSYDQADEIITKSVSFLVDQFGNA
jgi:uncharacterized protein